MKFTKALSYGIIGSVVLTATHQLLHKILDDAPRMDLMGEEAIKKITNKAGVDVPEEKLYGITMAGDIAINGIYYSMTAIGNPKNAVTRGGLIGLAAGIGAVCLPGYLGLTNAFSKRTFKTGALTMAIYTLGGLVTGLMVKHRK